MISDLRLVMIVKARTAGTLRLPRDATAERGVWGVVGAGGLGGRPPGQQSPLAGIRFPAARYSVSRRVTSTPPTSREVRLYTTEPIVDIAVISTMLSEPSRAV